MNASFNSSIKSKLGISFFILSVTLAATVATSVAEPSIKILRGSNQQTTYASAFQAPLVVWVTDTATQRAVAGLRVNFTAAAGIGLNSSYAITDEYGLASVNAAGLAATTSSVAAQVEGYPNTKVVFDGLQVNKAVLTVIPADLVSRADGTVPPITDYVIRGFVNGDTEASAQITGTPVLTTTATDHCPHANYAIKGGVGTLSSPNYTFVAGFGTLAVLGGSKSNGLGQQSEDAILAVQMKEESIEVRPALAGQPGTSSIRTPAFVAGLRGQSGVFVQTAILQTVSRTSGMPTSPSAVRGALSQDVVTTNALSSNAVVRSAVDENVITAVPSTGTVTVRSATFPALTTGDAPQSSLNGSSIRKALVVPASN
jgi:hypothetical protein